MDYDLINAPLIFLLSSFLLAALACHGEINPRFRLAARRRGWISLKRRLSQDAPKWYTWSCFSYYRHLFKIISLFIHPKQYLYIQLHLKSCFMFNSYRFFFVSDNTFLCLPTWKRNVWKPRRCDYLLSIRLCWQHKQKKGTLSIKLICLA